jgi:polar amino acid transport system substrate-binding protein
MGAASMRSQLFLAACMTLLLVLPASAERSFLFATDILPDPPYIIGEGTDFDQDKPGIEIELYQLVASKLNISIKFVRLPWKRALIQLKQGKIDGLFPANFQKKRMQIGAFPMENDQIISSLNVRKSIYHLYKHEESSLFWDGVTVKGVDIDSPVYAPLGWLIVDDMTQMGVPVEGIHDMSRAFKLLAANRIAGVVCPDTVADFYMDAAPENYLDIVKLDPPIKEKLYYLMLSHPFVQQYPELANKIWKTITEIKDSEQYRHLFEKYQFQ